jgi:sigma-B regulation protein RsbU (phosphoserine phosphatase)
MASLRSILRSEAKSGNSAADMLQSSNNLLNDDTHGNDVYATVFVALYAERENVIRYSNAGHPPALLWKAGSQEFRELKEGGTALGLFRDETYDTADETLQSGDILVIYTDGIVEAKNSDGEFYGDRRFRDAISGNTQHSSQELLDSILKSLELFQTGTQQRDDITLVIFKSR